MRPSRDDRGFGNLISWDVPLLDGYAHTFLSSYKLVPGSWGHWYLFNPGVLPVTIGRGFDAVWIHGWSTLTNLLTWGSAWVGRMPIILRAETNGLNEPRGLKRVCRSMLLKALFAQVSAFLAIGTNNRNFYRSHGIEEKKIFWTPYAVDNRFFMDYAGKLARQRLALREREGIALDKPVILFCGKLIPVKQPWDLLNAFRMINPERASLVFVGDGPLRAELERAVSNDSLRNIHFLGFRNQSEISECYALADALVLSSASETWGLAINEAMCFGLPIVASNCVGSAADLIIPGRNGYVYPVGNVEALAECLNKLIAREEDRVRMGQESLNIITQWGLDEDVRRGLQALSYLS